MGQLTPLRWEISRPPRPNKMAFYPSVQEVVQNFKKTPLVHKSDKKQTLDKKADTKVVIVAESGEYYDDYSDYNEGEYYNV